MLSDLYARVALSRVPGIGPHLFRALLTHFGTASEVLRAHPRELEAVEGIATQTASSFRTYRDRSEREATAILEFAERNEIQISCCLDATYPNRLANDSGSPSILYHLGQTDLQTPRTVAIIGTRQMTAYGSRQVERLLDPLADYAPLIVSGLAYGVDHAAHRRALQLGLPTLAVMGSGCQHVYPAQHRRTARQMVESGGGLLTEYPHWMKPDRTHFPARNRIVARMADLVVVVESGRRGGSIITVNMANDYGRRVGACPGRVGEESSAGCNELIKTGRAHLIETGEDIIRLLGWNGAAGRGKQRRLFDDLDAEETAVVDRLRDQSSVGLDDLRFALEVPASQLAGTLMMLEVKGVVKTLPGHRYRLSC